MTSNSTKKKLRKRRNHAYWDAVFEHIKYCAICGGKVTIVGMDRCQQRDKILMEDF